MTLFLFHFFDGETYSPDEFGLELADVESAYLEAVAAARGMWCELLAARRNPSECVFEIANEDGDILMRLDFAELAGGDSNRASRQRVSPEAIGCALEEAERRARDARDELRHAVEQARQSLAETNLLLARLASFERSATQKLPRR